MTQTEKSRSMMRVTMEPSRVPARQMRAVRDSSAGYFLRVKDCKMKKPDQPMMLPRSMRVPRTQCWSADSLLLWWAACRPAPWKISTIGPLYRVITMAPPIVTTVPATFAMLRIFLKFTLSSLPKTNQNQNHVLQFTFFFF